MKHGNIIINDAIIRQYNPCPHGIDAFNAAYPNFNGTLLQLLQLNNVSAENKLWLCFRVIKNADLWVVFAIECAIQAHEYNNNYAAYDAAYYADTAYAVYYAYAAANADTAAYYADSSYRAAYYACHAAQAAADYAAADYAADKEKERQIASLIYLLQNEEL